MEKMKNKKSPVERRKFLRMVGTALAGTSILAIGGASALATRGEESYFWQIDPELCTFCGLCETECVLPLSAVKAVHSIKMCGFCDLCGGYFISSARELTTAAENLLCPTGALQRRFIEDPYFEYSIIQDLCNGCGKCAKGCSAFGNGALYLQIMRDLCVDCNECRIATVCPPNAIVRVPRSRPYIRRMKV